MKVFVGIATCGRKDLLVKTLADLSRQTLLPTKVVIAPINRDQDVGELDLPESIRSLIEIVDGPAGTPAQRNTILRSLPKEGIVLFVDDDFVMHKDYCKELHDLYENNPGIVGCAGKILADGATNQGISFEHARELVDHYPNDEPIAVVDNGTTYGCNMSFRLATVIEAGIEFDENLPLYGWFEDLDFSYRVSRYGVVANTNRCVGVHMGHKAGRTSGLRLGYSQVVNPFYMWKKGTMTFLEAFNNVWKRFVANLVRSVWEESWVDRRGRLKGNLRGIREILLGTADPRRILEM